ncbi:hypothetical protein HDU96_002066 [Phlyctochytrium bullatum]|nr:hypothetical protein HDU96_002066 [Phlyctochytrium bullatum]
MPRFAGVLHTFLVACAVAAGAYFIWLEAPWLKQLTLTQGAIEIKLQDPQPIEISPKPPYCDSMQDGSRTCLFLSASRASTSSSAPLPHQHLSASTGLSLLLGVVDTAYDIPTASECGGDRPESPACVVVPSQNVTGVTSFFVANVEKFGLSLRHFVTVPSGKGQISVSNTDVSGSMVWKTLAGSPPKVMYFDRRDRVHDRIPLEMILDAAGISLDANVYGDTGSVRQQGGVIKISIEYTGKGVLDLAYTYSVAFIPKVDLSPSVDYRYNNSSGKLVRTEATHLRILLEVRTRIEQISVLGIANAVCSVAVLAAFAKTLVWIYLIHISGRRKANYRSIFTTVDVTGSLSKPSRPVEETFHRSPAAEDEKSAYAWKSSSPFPTMGPPVSAASSPGHPFAHDTPNAGILTPRSTHTITDDNASALHRRSPLPSFSPPHEPHPLPMDDSGLWLVSNGAMTDRSVYGGLEAAAKIGAVSQETIVHAATGTSLDGDRIHPAFGQGFSPMRDADSAVLRQSRREDRGSWGWRDNEAFYLQHAQSAVGKNT